MKKKYSIFSLIKNSFSNNENWQKMWENPEPKKVYDVIIVGGGGHGLGTAYYLAKEHGIKNIAVIEKVGSEEVIPVGTQQLLDQIIFGMKAPTFTIIL